MFSRRGRDLTSIAVWLCISVVCLLLGARLLALFRAAPEALAERALLSIGVGYVAFAYVVLLIGLTGQLYTSRVVAAALLCAVLSWAEFAFLGQCLARLWRKANDLRLPAVAVALYGFVGLWLLLGLVNALAPPGWLDWDGLSHHLAVPREYIRHHSVHYVAWTSHSNFPYATQMLFTVGLMLRGAAAAKLFHFVFAPLSLIALGVLCRRFLPAGCGPFAAVAYCCIPLVGWLAGVAYVDLGVAFFTILAAHFFLTWAVEGDGKGLPRVGLICGLGLCAKMQMGMVLAILLCLAVLASLLQRRDRLTASAGRIVAATGIAIAVCWPWYLKSYLWTGNPVYPFAYEIFGGRDFSAGDAAAYTSHQKHFGMPRRDAPPGSYEQSEDPSPRNLRYLLLAPWNITVHPRYFLVKNTAPAIIYSAASIGPMFLAFVPLLALARGRPAGVNWLLGFLGLSVPMWFVIMQLTRYLLPCLVVACVPVGYCLWACWQRAGAVRSSAAAMLTVSCVGVVAGGLYISLPQVGVALGLETEHAYLFKTLDTYRASQRINAFTPSEAKIATYDEPRVFYIDREVLWADPGHHQMIQYARMTSGEDLVARYRELGVTHILLAPGMARRIGDMGDRVHTLLLLRDAFRRDLLTVPDEMQATLLDSYVIAVVDYGQRLGDGAQE